MRNVQNRKLFDIINSLKSKYGKLQPNWAPLIYGDHTELRTTHKIREFFFQIISIYFFTFLLILKFQYFALNFVVIPNLSKILKECECEFYKNFTLHSFVLWGAIASIPLWKNCNGNQNVRNRVKKSENILFCWLVCSWGEIVHISHKVWVCSELFARKLRKQNQYHI